MNKSAILFLITILSVGIVGFAFLAPICHAAESSLTVTVYTDSNRVPINGATVKISGPENHTLTTGNSGIATFNNIAAGTYQVIVTAPGYLTRVSYSVQVSGETTAYASFSFTKARFTFSPSEVAVNSTVSFDGSPSTSSGDITSYSWTFGDNTNGTGINPTHIYSKSGLYTISLTITSTVGTATNSQIIQVGAPNQNYFFLWYLLIIPFLLPLLLLLRRRRHYYVVIQARIPPNPKHPHCPGNDTICENCKMAPC
jgi:hypothetical protein